MMVGWHFLAAVIEQEERKPSMQPSWTLEWQRLSCWMRWLAEGKIWCSRGGAVGEMGRGCE